MVDQFLFSCPIMAFVNLIFGMRGKVNLGIRFANQEEDITFYLGTINKFWVIICILCANNWQMLYLAEKAFGDDGNLRQPKELSINKVGHGMLLKLLY